MNTQKAKYSIISICLLIAIFILMTIGLVNGSKYRQESEGMTITVCEVSNIGIDMQ